MSEKAVHLYTYLSFFIVCRRTIHKICSPTAIVYIYIYIYIYIHIWSPHIAFSLSPCCSIDSIPFESWFDGIQD